MGITYRREKRGRKHEHIKALLRACADLKIDLSQSRFPDLSINRVSQVGLRRLGDVRENVIFEARLQGVNNELLYETARHYAPIPPLSESNRISRIHTWRLEEKLKRERERGAQTAQDVHPRLAVALTNLPQCNSGEHKYTSEQLAARKTNFDAYHSARSSWRDSFSEEPSDAVDVALARVTAKNALSVVVEAIGITASKHQITTATDRLKYLLGILRQKRLELILPDRAKARHRLNQAMLILQDYWARQPRGTGYLNRYAVAEWIEYCTVDEIRCVMDIAEGIWAALRVEMDRVVEARKKVTAAQPSEV